MRCDQRDLALLESRLLIQDVAHQSVRREHPRVRILPIVLHAPVADKNNQRPDPLIEVAIVLDDPIHLSGIRAALLERIFLFRKAADEQSFAISESDFASTALPAIALAKAGSELRLDCENTRGTDYDVINVETIPNQIVKGVVIADWKLARIACSCAAVRLRGVLPHVCWPT